MKERLLKTRKTYVFLIYVFSLENRTGAKRVSFIGAGRNYSSLLVSPSGRNGNILSPVWIEEMLKVEVLKHSNLPLLEGMMMNSRIDKEFKSVFGTFSILD